MEMVRGSFSNKSSRFINQSFQRYEAKNPGVSSLSGLILDVDVNNNNNSNQTSDNECSQTFLVNLCQKVDLCCSTEALTPIIGVWMCLNQKLWICSVISR